MANRAFQPDYELAAMNDVSGRRGIWYRANNEENYIEICAGREGDDCYIKIKVGDVISANDIANLAGIFSIGSWMIDDARQNEGIPDECPKCNGVIDVRFEAKEFPCECSIQRTDSEPIVI